MTACARHRPRCGRLWRLRSVRTLGVATALTSVVGMVVTVLLSPWVGGALFLIAAVAVAGVGWSSRVQLSLEMRLIRALLASRHTCPGQVDVPGLGADVRAELGVDGVTAVHAQSWRDAVRVLGFVMGRDRAFQLDLLRRTVRGRLAEVWGKPMLPADRHHRRLGLGAAAERAVAALDTPERELLADFATGVNAAFRHGSPFEARFLSYRMEPWTPEDSVVVALYLFHTLSWSEPAKRAESVLRRALPDEVAAFFLPAPTAPPRPANLASFRGPSRDGVIAPDRAIAGSNCWVTDGPEGPVLACDLHLSLSLPNLLYEVDLRWDDRHVRGLTTVGLPIILTGSNGRLAWGVTNLSGDVLDLVPVSEEDVRTSAEDIRVRGGSVARIDVSTVDTAPVAPSPLLGERVATRWSGYDPRAADLKFQRLVHTDDVAGAISVLDSAHGIALNVLLTDTAGERAHLTTGLLPRRPGTGAVEYLTGDELPGVVNPESGILVSANDATLPEGDHRILYDPDTGSRARRIRQVLGDRSDSGPRAMRMLQHDTSAELFVPYRDLALTALAGTADPVIRLLKGWSGRADVESRAFPVLVRLRELLAQRVLSPFLSACADHDPDFRYAFRCVDRPLLDILGSGDPDLLPPGEESWNGFLTRCVDDVVADLTGRPARTARERDLPTWGELNMVGLTHPMADLVPWARPLLDLAPRPQAGTLHTVRACAPGFAAAGRAVIVPGADRHAYFDLPGGQSGHPLSPHYADRHQQWANAGPRDPRATGGTCTYMFHPASQPEKTAQVDTVADTPTGKR